VFDIVKYLCTAVSSSFCDVSSPTETFEQFNFVIMSDVCRAVGGARVAGGRKYVFDDVRRVLAARLNFNKLVGRIIRSTSSTSQLLGKQGEQKYFSSFKRQTRNVFVFFPLFPPPLDSNIRSALERRKRKILSFVKFFSFFRVQFSTFHFDSPPPVLCSRCFFDSVLYSTVA
jgi:hypothetical protein